MKALHPKCNVFTNFTTLIKIPTIGLEPITLKWEQILNLSCLPISPSRRIIYVLIK